MLQLKNQSPFAPALGVLPNRDAVDTVYVVVKGTFVLGPRLEVAEKPAPPVLADEYWGAPGQSSLKYPSDLHVGKSGSDLLLVGQAWAAGGRPASEAMVRVTVAERSKTVHVFGDRTWKREGFTRPEPFESLPLRYERAYGGAHADGANLVAEEHNPIGRGFLGKRRIDSMVGQKLPNFEDPRRLLQQIGDVVAPAGLGAVAPSWLPRRQYAGTYDQAWQRKRAPYLPADFQPRFFNCAAPELTFDRFLAGGETVEIIGASREGAIRFQLPRRGPRVTLFVAGAREQPPCQLETVIVEPDDRKVFVVWRAELPVDKNVRRVQLALIEGDADGAGRGG